MSGFFNRLAQRTLGIAWVVRPAIVSRFAQVSSATNEFPSTDAIEDLAQQSSEISNPNAKPKWQKPVTDRVKANSMDSPHSQEQPRQTELRQAEHGVDPHPGRNEKQPAQNKRISNIVKPATAGTKEFSDPVRPVKDFKNDTDAPKIRDDKKAQKMSVETKKPVDTVKPIAEAQKIPNDQANGFDQFNLEQDQFTARGPRAAEAPLLPMPHQQSQNNGNAAASFNDFGYAIDVHRVSGKEDLQSTDTRKQQSLDKSQTINVTIGRIEVRAVHSAPTPLKREKAKTNPALSLEDYLQQRQRGER